MKTFIKYFVLLAVSANACSLQAMGRQYQWKIIDETAEFSGTADKPASSEKRELESCEASSSCSIVDFQQPPRKKRETEDDMTKLLRVALARAKEELDHSHTPSIAGTSTSSSAASSSSASAPILAPSMHPIYYPSKLPNRIRANVILIQRLPCLWPSTPPCHEIFGNLDDLLKHIYQHHINKDYEYDTKHCLCPLCSCTTRWPARLMYHFFYYHHGLRPLRPWQCSICKKRSSNPEVLSRKSHPCKVTEPSTGNATSEKR